MYSRFFSVRFLARRIINTNHKITNNIRQIITKIVYPGVKFGKNVYLDKGANIRVTDGGILLIDDNVHIGQNSILIVEKNGCLKIGRQTYIGPNALLGAIEHIYIGEDCLIAEGVTIRDQNHGTEIGEQPFRLQKPDSAPIIIENNVWLGAKATILKGVRIGKNTVVGAHAVVNRSLPENSIAVGVPARVINQKNKH
jgi:acetyltransferase-like isoleucine patch superfamily enzyme